MPGSEPSNKLTLDALPDLLNLLRLTVSRVRPEQALADQLVKLTGGFVEIRASWGDVVASAGEKDSEAKQIKLIHAERHIGQLSASFPAPWQLLTPVAAEYALLARLQSAAAGAARRRVGERTLEVLLSGQGDAAALAGDSFAVALATFVDEPGRGTAAQAAQAHALDVLAGVGEGYLAERKLGGFCTVRASQAIWLWSTHALKLETQGLFTALTESTGRKIKLGVSAVHSPPDFRNALEEAVQSLASLRAAGMMEFTKLDTMQELLQSPALDGLRAQVRAQLASVDVDGKVEATLKAYLAHSGTLQDLANKQRVHVNTLRYRLKLAEKAMKGSLNDPATTSRLFLALGPSRASQELKGHSSPQSEP